MRQVIAGIGVLFLGAIFAVDGSAGPRGTTLVGQKDAAAIVTQKNTYQWTIEKTPVQTSFSIPKGTTVPIEFTIQVSRSGPVFTSTTSPITGKVCLTNGDFETSGLHLTDRIEENVGGLWTAISPEITLPVTAELLPHETRCWDYSFTGIELDPAKQYRNHAVASIDNWDGNEGTDHPIDIYATVMLTVNSQTLDASATLDDSFSCPAGFTCVLPWNAGYVTDSVTLSYTVLVTNDSVFCGSFSLTNLIQLTTSDTLTVSESRGTVTVDAGPCGCTGTIGYWKTHPDLIPPLLPQYLGTMGGTDTLAVTTPQIALDVLNQNVYGDASNGITKLYAQLLAAKLAIQKGADPTVILSTIAAADLFLATHSYTDWSSLTAEEQAQVIAWQSMLANYNLGNIGPGHC